MIIKMSEREVKKDYDDVARQARKYQCPIVITKGGAADVVLMSVEAYEKLARGRFGEGCEGGVTSADTQKKRVSRNDFYPMRAECKIGVDKVNSFVYNSVI